MGGGGRRAPTCATSGRSASHVCRCSARYFELSSHTRLWIMGVKHSCAPSSRHSNLNGSSDCATMGATMYFGLPMLLNHAQPRSFLVTGPPAATAADVTVFVAAAAAATEGALMVAIRAGAMFSQASDGQRVNSGSCRRRAQIIASLQINKTAKSMRTFPDRQDTSAVPIVSRRAPPRQGLLTVVEEPPRVCCVRHGKQGVAVPPCRLGGNAPAEQRWPGGRCTLQKCCGAGPASVAVAPAPGTMMANSPEKLSLAVLQEPPTVFYNQQGGKYESFEVHVVSAKGTGQCCTAIVATVIVPPSGAMGDNFHSTCLRTVATRLMPPRSHARARVASSRGAPAVREPESGGCTAHLAAHGPTHAGFEDSQRCHQG